MHQLVIVYRVKLCTSGWSLNRVTYIITRTILMHLEWLEALWPRSSELSQYVIVPIPCPWISSEAFHSMDRLMRVELPITEYKVNYRGDCVSWSKVTSRLPPIVPFCTPFSSPVLPHYNNNYYNALMVVSIVPFSSLSLPFDGLHYSLTLFLFFSCFLSGGE